MFILVLSVEVYILDKPCGSYLRYIMLGLYVKVYY